MGCRSGNRLVGMPHFGIGASGHGRDYKLGHIETSPSTAGERSSGRHDPARTLSMLCGQVAGLRPLHPLRALRMWASPGTHRSCRQ